MRNSEEDKIDIRCGLDVSKFNAEQKQRWNEALFKSKGKSNSRLGSILVGIGASVDEVVKFTKGVTDYTAVCKSRNNKLIPNERVVNQTAKCIPDFWETVRGRKLKGNQELLEKVGIDSSKRLPVTKLDAKLSQYYLNRSFKAVNSSYSCFKAQYGMHYDAGVAKKILVASVFEPIADVKFKPLLGGKSPLEKIADCTMADDDKVFSKYKECRRYEIDSLAHMDASLCETIQPVELFCDCLSHNLGYNLTNYPTSSYAIQTTCVIEGFYSVCKEMGIVGVRDDSVDGRGYCSAAACIGIMKNIIKMAGTYRRLVKGGFAESVARATVLSEINDAIARRATCPAVRFYPRNDYEDTPEEERAKPSKSSTASRGSRKTVKSWEEFLRDNGGGE